MDLCEPRHKRYHVALTVVMGKNMDAVVVDNEKTAAECITYLKHTKAGTGTFIPLDSVKTKPLKEHLRKLSNGSKLVHDVIKFPDEIQVRVEFGVVWGWLKRVLTILGLCLDCVWQLTHLCLESRALCLRQLGRLRIREGGQAPLLREPRRQQGQSSYY